VDEAAKGGAAGARKLNICFLLCYWITVGTGSRYLQINLHINLRAMS